MNLTTGRPLTCIFVRMGLFRAGAVAQGLPEAVETAASFLGALRERGFRGDEEMAGRLCTAMGDAAIPFLRPLAVDLEMLAMRPLESAWEASSFAPADSPCGCGVGCILGS